MTYEEPNNIAVSEEEPLEQAIFFKRHTEIKEILQLPIIGEFELRYGGSPNESTFKRTENKRQLIDRSSDYSYAEYLFGLTSDQEDDERVASIKERITDKNILNIGGGDSLNDLLAHDGRFAEELTPHSLVSIDPFVSSEKIEKNERGFYKSLMNSAADPDLERVLEENDCPNKYDEIWCLYSCPVYLTTSSEIHDFFNNVRNLLKTGSILRIFPLQVCVTRDGVYSRNIDERKKKIREEIETFVTSEEYQVYITPRSTTNGLLIRKL